jgi:hypothetical protein
MNRDPVIKRRQISLLSQGLFRQIFVLPLLIDAEKLAVSE